MNIKATDIVNCNCFLKIFLFRKKPVENKDGFLLRISLCAPPHCVTQGSGLTKPLALSPELADIVGAKKGEQLSRPEVVKRIWAYLKEKKLQDPENKQYFVPDKKMEPIFGKDKVRAFGMAKFLKAHLTNP